MSLVDRLLAGLLRSVFAGLRALGPVHASNLGGAVGRGIGPWLAVSRVADANLRAALPMLDAAGRRGVIRGVWDNLGRTVGELPNLDRLGPSGSGPGWEIVASPATLAAARGGSICFAGHLANWEVLLALARVERLPFGVFYRAAGSPAVDQVIRTLRARAGGGRLSQFAKGAAGARLGIAHLRRGGTLGMLVDQKANDGIAVDFFGRPAMTAPALAALALKFQVPVIPVRVMRLGPARLRIELAPPLNPPVAGDAAAMMRAVNDCLEGWIRERPGEWLWLHRRWPKRTERDQHGRG